MSDNIELVIEIPKDIYERCKEYKLWSYDAETLEGAVATSKPLSEVKAEIEKKYREVEFMDEFSSGYNYAISEALEAIDNIGKSESEVKPNETDN